jgi:hypothetical protein
VLRTVPALRAHDVVLGDDPFATLARLPTT